jgi:hypothetical protein
VAGDQLLHERLVGGLREPALLVDQRHDAHGLRWAFVRGGGR